MIQYDVMYYTISLGMHFIAFFRFMVARNINHWIVHGIENIIYENFYVNNINASSFSLYQKHQS